jgi:hypothetical protein
MINKRKSGIYYTIRIQVNKEMHDFLKWEANNQGIKVSKLLKNIAMELLKKDAK